MPNTTCSIDGCSKAVRATGWCRDHYNRWYQTGDPLTPPKRIPNEQCVAPGCDRTPRSATAKYCEMHYYRLRRNGVLEANGNEPGERHHGWVGDSVSYRALHTRVMKARGRASDHQCIDCGRRAEQWSYDHECPNERHAEQGVYSTNIDHYQPRCRSCHKRFDNALV